MRTKIHFYEIWYLKIFWHSIEKFQASLKFDKNKEYFIWGLTYIFYDLSLIFFLEWEMFQTKVVEKVKTHILSSVNFSFWKSCRLLDNMKKILQSGADHRWKYGACALHAGYLRLQVHNLLLCNAHRFSTATTFARTRLNVTLYVHILSCHISDQLW